MRILLINSPLLKTGLKFGMGFLVPSQNFLERVIVKIITKVDCLVHKTKG